MSNMSYCRFQNTLNDLRDCQDALEELATGDVEPLSPEELSAAKRLVTTCADILRLINDYDGDADDGEILEDERYERALDATNEEAADQYGNDDR